MENNLIGHIGIKFDLPTSWRHGRGIVSQTGKVLKSLGCRRPLILTDKYLLSAGIVEPVINSLKNNDITYFICDEVIMAMTAAMNSYLGLCHAMAMPLCALYKIPHGQVCGLLLPHVLKYNSPAVREKVDHIFNIMGFKDGYEGTHSLLNDLKLSAGLTDFGFKDSHLQTIIQGTRGSAQMPTNPRAPTDSDIIDIVKKII